MNTVTISEPPVRLPSTGMRAAVGITLGATLVSALLFALRDATPLGTDAFCWTSLALATIALAPVLWLAATRARSMPVLLISTVALATYVGAALDAANGVESVRFLTTGLAACLALQTVGLSRAAAAIPGPQWWPRWWVAALAGVVVAATVLWLLREGASETTYDVVLAVALGAIPTAFGVAVLAPMVLGTARAARHGVVIRHTSALERAAEVRSLVLDGLDTLVAGKHVTEVVPVEESHRRNLRWFAGALAHADDDPVSNAISRLSVRGNVTSVTRSLEWGLTGNVDRHPVRLTLPEAIGLSAVDPDLVPGETVGVEVDLRPLGVIRVEDSVRPGAAHAVSTLRQAGIEQVLITSATMPTAAMVMGETGIEHRVDRHGLATDLDVTVALGMCPDPTPAHAAVLSPRRLPMADYFYLGPRSDVVGLDDASIEQAALAIRIGRAIWALTHQARLVALVAQGVVVTAAITGVLPPWAAALGAVVASAGIWTLVMVALPNPDSEAEAESARG